MTDIHAVPLTFVQTQAACRDERAELLPEIRRMLAQLEAFRRGLEMQANGLEQAQANLSILGDNFRKLVDKVTTLPPSFDLRLLVRKVDTLACRVGVLEQCICAGAVTDQPQPDDPDAYVRAERDKEQFQRGGKEPGETVENAALRPGSGAKKQRPGAKDSAPDAAGPPEKTND